jgi:hypothetical protein
MKTDDITSQDISWSEIQEYVNNHESYKAFMKQIPLSIYKMALDKKEKPKVLKAVMKILRENDSTNASEEYAQIIVERMQKLAKEILSKKT